MIVILSPSKNLNFKPQTVTGKFTRPMFMDEASKLAEKVRKLNRREMAELMDINPRLTGLNRARFMEWSSSPDTGTAKQAILAFNGDVYTGLNAKMMKEPDLVFAQGNLVILSGLYGVLRPLDMIQPYRLEMGIDLKVGRAADLYEFWGSKITDALNRLLKKHKHKAIINLASLEYSQSIDPKSLDAEWITPTFKEFRGNGYHIFFVFLKRARGMMARFMIENRITRPEDMKAFDTGGYYYNEDMSAGLDWVFTR